MNVNTVDLNLFLVFQAIYVTRSVTHAGDRIGLTQSAASHALKRMRARFNDPLFVRTPEGMVPTPLADQLIVPIESGLGQFARVMDQGCRFDPATSDRTFRIAVNDIAQLVMIPRLLTAAHECAPAVSFETVDAGLPDARQSMTQGQVDLAVGSWKAMGQTFYQQRLFDETFVILMSANHPLSQARIGMDEYLSASHIAYRPSGATETELQNALHRAGVPGNRKVVLTAAHSLGLSTITATSNLLLTVPGRLAQALAAIRPDLHIAPLPFDVRPFPIRQQWHERFQHDSGNRWLRQMFFSLFHEPSARLDGLPSIKVEHNGEFPVAQELPSLSESSALEHPIPL